MKSTEYYESEMELLRVENGRLRKENEGLKEEVEFLKKRNICIQKINDEFMKQMFQDEE